MVSDAQQGGARRLVSLAPSATDLVVSLGLVDHLVGVSHACDHLAVSDRSRLTRTRVPVGTAAEIDAWVSGAARAGEALYVLDEAMLETLAPDLILAQVVCDVCALDGRDPATLQQSGAPWLNLDGASWEGLKRDLQAIALHCGVDARAQTLIEEWVPQIPGDRPTPLVLALEWDDPLFLGGHWVPEWIARAGGAHLLVPAHQVSPRASWDDVLQADPDIILIMPCGYSLEAAWQATLRLMQTSPLPQTRAAQNGQVWALEANQPFSRIGPHSIEAINVLAAIFFPGCFPPPSTGAARQWYPAV